MKHFSCFLLVAAVVLGVAVACDDDDTSTSSPTLTISESSLSVPYEGGEYGFTYTLSNTRDDGVFNVACDSAWISDITVHSDEDSISYIVNAQTERVSRKCEINVTYTYGDSTVITRTLTIRQALNNYYSLEATEAWGTYYGTMNTQGDHNTREYSVIFSDKPLEDGEYAAGGTYYIFDFWSSLSPSDTDAIVPPTGIYSIGDAEENASVDIKTARYIKVSEDGEEYEESCYFAEGTITVVPSGSDLSVTTNLTDEAGNVHEMTYLGPLSLENDSFMSSLGGEGYDLGDFSGIDCEARYYGDYFGAGTANWVLCIYAEGETGYMLDICGDSSYTYDNGELPTGTFTITSTGGTANTMLAGNISHGYLNGTWLVTLDADGALAEPYAPIVSGSATIEGSSDAGYTITIEGADDMDGSITGTWSGTPTLADYTATKAPGFKTNLKLR